MAKLISWNIDSINAALTSSSDRAILSQAVLKKLGTYQADIIAIQETKLPADGPSEKHLELLKEYFPDYKIEWISSIPPAKKGYAGTMILYRENLAPQAKRQTVRLGAPDTMDDEGRLLTIEFENFYFVNVYTPNSGDGLKRLAERQKWDVLYAEYLAELDKKKPVIACGDFNVAHKEIDLANPASNHFSAGFTDEERDGFTKLLAKGFTDSFRFVHGDVKDIYSWWGQRIKTSKINNSGWRIDYFLVSDRIKDQIKKSEMIDSGPRQDHTPILLEIDVGM
ncbi:MAG: exodeoxyribonuclease III [Treponema sp.]|nr:exodeoxyribonuclease III [Treponema sp.]